MSNKSLHVQVRTNFKAAFHFHHFWQGLSAIYAEFGKITAQPSQRSLVSGAGQQNVPEIEIPQSIHIRRRKPPNFDE